MRGRTPSSGPARAVSNEQQGPSSWDLQQGTGEDKVGTEDLFQSEKHKCCILSTLSMNARTSGRVV